MDGLDRAVFIQVEKGLGRWCRFLGSILCSENEVLKGILVPGGALKVKLDLVVN
jgi:hypothetical protein